MPFSYGNEVYRLIYPDHSASPRRAATNGFLSYGLPFPQACLKHASDTFHASRVYVISSRTLSNVTSALDDLKAALGSKLVGVRIGMRPHTLWSECVEIVNECRELEVDLIVTLGGGTLTDAAKLVALALANDVKTTEDLKSLPTAVARNKPIPRPPKVPVVCIPTSLSGGEYTNYAGATEDVSQVKYQFTPPVAGPALVILDPELTTTTPERMWLSPGMRSVDHCVETLCALQYTEKGDRDAAAGLRALVSGLLRCKLDPEDLDARHASQMGSILAIGGVCRQTSPALAASHAIGHMLGPLGVAHGETSCILLPAVCKYNAAKGANVDRQKAVLKILWELPEIQALGLAKETADLGDILDAFIRALGMPRTLKAVGVEGREKLEKLAENTLLDEFAGTNPAPLKTKEDVMEILNMVRG